MCSVAKQKGILSVAKIRDEAKFIEKFQVQVKSCDKFLQVLASR